MLCSGIANVTEKAYNTCELSTRKPLVIMLNLFSVSNSNNAGGNVAFLNVGLFMLSSRLKMEHEGFFNMNSTVCLCFSFQYSTFKLDEYVEWRQNRLGQGYQQEIEKKTEIICYAIICFT